MKFELDKNITKADERVEYIKDVLDINEVKEEYNSEIDSRFYSVSEDIYVSRRIESTATYILKGEVSWETAGTEYIHDLLTDVQRNEKEKSRVFIPKGEGLSEEDIMKQANKLNSNRIKYKDNTVKVTNHLVNEETELGEILRDYQSLREALSNQLQKCRLGEPTKEIRILNNDNEIITVQLNFNMIKNNLSEVSSDMILIIKYKKGLDGLRPKPVKPASLDIDNINYRDCNQIKILLNMYNLKEQGSIVESDEVIIVADLNKALKKINLSAKDMDILEKYNDGYTITEIAQEKDVHKSNISRCIDKICRLIAKEMS